MLARLKKPQFSKPLTRPPMPMIYVKPSPGGRVRMPERNFRPMPEAGAWV
jgi:hypothetical protein